MIPKGSETFYFSMLGDGGTIWSGHYHPDCRAAEVRLNEMAGWFYGDDWLLLHEAESEQRDVLRGEFPAVYARWEEERERYRREHPA